MATRPRNIAVISQPVELGLNGNIESAVNPWVILIADRNTTADRKNNDALSVIHNRLLPAQCSFDVLASYRQRALAIAHKDSENRFGERHFDKHPFHFHAGKPAYSASQFVA